MKALLASLLVVAAAASALAASALARPAAPVLKGSVGPSYTISLTQNGHKVKTLKAGAYTVAVTDKGSDHSFVLEQVSGGKFEKTITGVGFRGKKSLAVRLTKGKWKFYCSMHESDMFGFFKVT
jgi:hypothetical protein